MTVFNHTPYIYRINPPPPKGTHFAVEVSPDLLRQSGFNMPVEISTASIFRMPPLNMAYTAIVVMAHFDTGASATSIDVGLAKYLNLFAQSYVDIRTAAGSKKMPTYAVDISFCAASLLPFHNLRINSCELGFVFNDEPSIRLHPRNMGILIGRDIMSHWNIIWNGPTSTVIISD